MSSKRFEKAISAIIAICAIAITSTVVIQAMSDRSSNQARLDPNAAAPRLREDVWSDLQSTSTRVTGHDSARVQMVIFTDFQCPACRFLHTQLQPIIEEFGERIAVSFIHFPLPRYPHSARAAQAFECAVAQREGLRWANELFQAQDSIGIIGWGEFALRSGVRDTAELVRCSNDDGEAGRIVAGRSIGRKLRIEGTPSVYINSWAYVGVPTARELSTRIEALLAEGEK